MLFCVCNKKCVKEQLKCSFKLNSGVLLGRWNPRSEHLQRKAYHTAGRAASLDELEEFAATYKQRQGRGERLDCDTELRELSRYPTERQRSPQNYYSDINEFGDGGRGEDRLRRDRSNRRAISPISSPKRSRGDGDRERPVPPPPPSSASTQEKDYDGALLSSLLERKARLRETGHGASGARSEGDSDTPSKGSSRQSSGESGRHRSRSPGYRAEEADPHPGERQPADRLSPRPAKTRPAHSTAEEPRDRSRKVVSLLAPGPRVSQLVVRDPRVGRGTVLIG